MRRYIRLVLVIVIASIGLYGSCLSYALYPWFDKEVQTFDERLLGKWGDEEDFYIVTRGAEQTYLITEQNDQDKTDYRALLAKIGDGYYLDLKVEQSTDTLDAWELKAHLLCKLAIEPDRLRVVCLDDEVVEKRVASGELRGARVEQGKFLIVSGTEELQKFVAKHGPGSEIWIEEEDEAENWLSRM